MRALTVVPEISHPPSVQAPKVQGASPPIVSNQRFRQKFVLIWFFSAQGLRHGVCLALREPGFRIAPRA